MMSRILSLFLVVLVALSAFAAYRLLEASLAAEVYRGRLVEMSRDYQALLERHNEAVRRTAVTELLVEDGQLTVVIRTAEGDLQSLPSPFDPSKEIYVDYVVHDGRLWIRRLFDEDTPPGEGMVIDPRFVDVEWEMEGESHGKAAYRSLGEGRWVVDVTGDGSLGLSRRDPSAPLTLSPPPPVRSYEPVETEVEDRLGSIGAIEAIEALARQLEVGA
jgi:hypothetical protein